MRELGQPCLFTDREGTLVSLTLKYFFLHLETGDKQKTHAGDQHPRSSLPAAADSPLATLPCAGRISTGPGVFWVTCRVLYNLESRRGNDSGLVLPPASAWWRQDVDPSPGVHGPHPTAHTVHT